MPDANTLALVSVVSSAGVAVLATTTQALVASRSRSHERRLAVEGRIWPARVEVLQQAMTFAHSLERLVHDYRGLADVDQILPALRSSRARLDGPLSSDLMLYGSYGTREHVRRLQRRFSGLQLDDEEAWRRLGTARRRKSTSLDDRRFDDAADARQEEILALEAVGMVPTAIIGLSDATTDLMDAVRADLWGTDRSRPPRLTRSRGWLTSWSTLRRLRRIRNRAGLTPRR